MSLFVWFSDTCNQSILILPLCVFNYRILCFVQNNRCLKYKMCSFYNICMIAHFLRVFWFKFLWLPDYPFSSIHPKLYPKVSFSELSYSVIQSFTSCGWLYISGLTFPLISVLYFQLPAGHLLLRLTVILGSARHTLD